MLLVGNPAARPSFDSFSAVQVPGHAVMTGLRQANAMQRDLLRRRIWGSNGVPQPRVGDVGGAEYVWSHIKRNAAVLTLLQSASLHSLDSHRSARLNLVFGGVPSNRRPPATCDDLVTLRLSRRRLFACVHCEYCRTLEGILTTLSASLTSSIHTRYPQNETHRRSTVRAVLWR